MLRRTPTGLKTTTATTPASASRKCASWIESFIEDTVGLDTPVIFRKWSAISAIAAAIEQRVCMITGKGELYPNIYCMLIAHPGVGKTATIRKSKRYYMETLDPHLAPTSLTGASMIDAMTKNKRFMPLPGKQPLDYNSMYLNADELGSFMHKYDSEIISVMSSFYDPDEFRQWRRGNDLKVQIKCPQLNVICGSTPSNLMNTLPEFAWEQGFTSRVILIFSDERIIGDDFVHTDRALRPDLVHDLKRINSLLGEFEITSAYRDAVTVWRAAGEPTVPTHPKLLHYATRRRVHLYKLSMVSSIDRGDSLLLTARDWERALDWLAEAEAFMPDIFKAGAGNADSKAMDEIYHYVLTSCAGGRKIPAFKIINFAKVRVPLHSIDRVITTMEKSGLIKQAGLDPKVRGQVLYVPGARTDDPLAPGALD
jgi:hypothetical protein